MACSIDTLQTLLQTHEVDALLIENPIDLLYLTGLSLSAGTIVIQPNKTELLVDSRYVDLARKNSPFPAQLKGEGWAERLQGTIGFDSAFTSYDGYLNFSSKFPNLEWKPVSSPLRQMRLYKSPEEVAALRRTAQVTADGQTWIQGLLKEGISEAELALAFEEFCRRNGASGMAFEPIIAFGENSAYPHYRGGMARLEPGQIVLMDTGAIVDHYHGDRTRMAFFGEVNPRLTHLFELVRRGHRKAIEAVRPGICFGELDQLVRDEFKKEGVEHLFTHSLGHGIGLETHEYPRVRAGSADADLALEPGMVFTIEPGLYEPGLGGVRYEDMILVTQDGHENLSGDAYPT